VLAEKSSAHEEIREIIKMMNEKELKNVFACMQESNYGKIKNVLSN
jgi:hypothetical protein